MDKLIIPVYLNQRMVFDLIAMLQGGISTVTAVTQTSSESMASQQEISAGFRVSDVISTLFKVDISGGISDSNAQVAGTTAFEERIHTPASLFYQLRTLLVERGHLVSLEETPPNPGDFIEFEGALERNPIVETIDSMAAMIGIAMEFEDKPQRKQSNSKNVASQNEKLHGQIQNFSNRLKEGGTIDLIARNVFLNEYSAVITVETGYLNDASMSDLVDGQFRVLGKVTKCIYDESGSINLLRKTALSKLPQSILTGFTGVLDSLGDEQGFDVPRSERIVKGPAVQILPISIFA